MPIISVKPGQLIVTVADTGEIRIDQVTSGTVTGVTTNTVFDDSTSNLVGAVNCLINQIYKAKVS